MKILEQLNTSQRTAVEYCEGPELVIAGAGSGKTRVLTYKIAYLLQLGLEPWNILALTFTNKAAHEMKRRVSELVGEEKARLVKMGTFHSVFSRILRKEAEKLGYQAHFTIYDETDSRSLIKTIIRELGLDDKIYKPAMVQHNISMAKNHLITAEMYASDKALHERDQQARMPALSQIYTNYSVRCRRADAMDFDDLLLQTYLLFHTQEPIRQKYARLFQYVLVDEYQDTNYAQQAIVSQLTNEHRHVCVVGDDAQSIYAFRGANIDNILNFQQTYKEARLFKLEQNYRSTQRIVMAANSLIRKNTRQIQKDVFSEKEEGEKLSLYNVASDKEEAMVVCREIKRLKREDQSAYSDFAILYRTNAQSRSFEEEMRRQAIPYRIYGGLSFYQRKEIKDIIAYFRLINNPADEEAFKRIINYPTRGIGNISQQKIVTCAQRHGVSLWQVISNPPLYHLEINKTTAIKIGEFRNMISDFRGISQSVDAYTLGKQIIQLSGISSEIYSGRDPESLSRQENLEEFVTSLQTFVEEKREEGRENEIYLDDFLQEVALMTDIDSEGSEEESRVVLMTVHAAKGLEFPTVFIVGLEENLFPSAMASGSLRGIEEERRLFYVAITRAEKHCILTTAKFRYRYGNAEFQTPSRFLQDIDTHLLNVQGGQEGKSPDFSGSPIYSWGQERYYQKQSIKTIWGHSERRPMDPNNQKLVQPHPPVQHNLLQKRTNFRKVSELLSANAGEKNSLTERVLKEGSIIEHQRFGVGKVLRIEGVGENTKATVEFKNTGMKQLLLKFAKYEVLA